MHFLLGSDMQEPAHLVQQTLIHIVDIGIQHLTAAFHRRDVIVGYRGRNQTTVSLAQFDLVACTSYSDLTVALQTHADDETVVLDEVAVEGLVKLRHLHTKVW